jgi:Xaa-Pro aminopeptidase
MLKEGYEAVLAYSALRWTMMGGTESGGNARYYVGFNYPHEEMRKKGTFVPYLGRDSIVFIPREGKPAFLARARKARAALDAVNIIKEQSWMDDVRPVYGIFPKDNFQVFAEMVKDLFGERDLKPEGKIGVGGINTPMELWIELNHLFPKASIHNITDDLGRLRMVKSENELKLMRAAAKINNAALSTMIEVCRPGVAEWEVHQAMEATMFKHGADNVWNIVHSGPRSWARGSLPDFTQRTLKEGDMISCDYGCEYSGYHSDTNYALIIGEGRREQKDILKLIIKMMDAMLSITREGVTDTELVLVAMESAKGTPYEKYVWTNFGHSYGCGGEIPSLDVEVQPHKTREQQIEIKANMLFCYEPAVYVPNIGGACLEDEIIVTTDGYEVLTYNTYEAKRALGLSFT